MTTVAISLSEMRRFQPNPQGRNRARRSLFGSVDHQENQRFLHRELDRIARQDSRRWNFDFTNESPLPGRYAWEPVNDEVHPAYSLARLPYLSHHASSPESTEGTPTATAVSGDSNPEEESTVATASTSSAGSTSTTTAEKTKQTIMTDFLQSRKRKNVSKVSSVPKVSEPTSTSKKKRLT